MDREQRIRRYAALELISAELADEQPQTAAQVREEMRRLITEGGLRLDERPATYEEMTGVRPILHDNDPRGFVP